jgi:hypothetical protein
VSEAILGTAGQAQIDAVDATPGWTVIGGDYLRHTLIAGTLTFEAILCVTDTDLAARARLFDVTANAVVPNSTTAQTSSLTDVRLTAGILSSDLTTGHVYQIQVECTGDVGETLFALCREARVFGVTYLGDTGTENPFFNTVTVAEKIDLFTGQDGGWQDELGQIIVRTTGAGNPSWSQIGASIFRAYKFAVGDICQIHYHLTHGLCPGTAIFPHVHWTTDGTDANTVKFELSVVYAKGYKRGNFDFASPDVFTVEEAPDGTAYNHVISEDGSGLALDTEVDGLVIVHLARVTNGGTDNEDDVFVLMADVHYQADTVATKTRNYPFY